MGQPAQRRSDLRTRVRASVTTTVVALALVVACATAPAATSSSPSTAVDGQRAPEVRDAPTTTIATTTTSRPPRRVTVAGAGDILLHMPVQRQALTYGGGKVHDFTPMFSDIKDEISAADVAICHQETPVSMTNVGLSGYPIFNAPREIATALAAAGFDGCDTASNHSIDKGFDGVKSTGDAFDAAGLKHTGSFRTAEEAVDGGGVLYPGNAVTVGHLAYTYGTNGLPIPPDKPWLLNLNDATKMLADAKALKARGAEIVVMSVHWGAEYQTAPTPDQRALAAQLLASPDIDLVLGDHVHVVQPLERIGDEYVIYGMGNFLSNQSPSSDRTLGANTQDGALFTFTFEEQPDGSFRAVGAAYTPTYVNRPDYRIIKVGPAVHPESFVRTVKAVNSLGAGAHDALPSTGPVPPDALPPTTSTTTTTAPTTTAPTKVAPTTAPTTVRARP